VVAVPQVVPNELIRATHVVIRAMQSEQLVIQNMLRVQQSIPSAVDHQHVKTSDRVHLVQTSTDLVDHKSKDVRQFANC
jgi:hypothetical protein